MQVKGNQGRHVHEMTKNRYEKNDKQNRNTHCKNRASKQTKQTNKNVIIIRSNASNHIMHTIKRRSIIMLILLNCHFLFTPHKKEKIN